MVGNCQLFKWLFVPDSVWLESQLAAISELAEEKLGLFYWLYDTLSNFFACFSNLQDYTGLKIHMSAGKSVTLFYGEFWTTAMRYINPLLTGAFVVFFCVFCFRKITTMFDR